MSVGSSRSGVMDARNRTWILWKSTNALNSWVISPASNYFQKGFTQCVFCMCEYATRTWTVERSEEERSSGAGINRYLWNCPRCVLRNKPWFSWGPVSEPSLQPWFLGTLCFETGSYCVALAGLELKDPACLCLVSAGIKGIHHHTRLLYVFWDNVLCSSDCSWIRNVPNNKPWAASATAALGLNRVPNPQLACKPNLLHKSSLNFSFRVLNT